MTRWDVCLCSVLLLTTMGLAYGATLQNPEDAKELAEKVLSRAVAGDMDGIATVVKPIGFSRRTNWRPWLRRQRNSATCWHIDSEKALALRWYAVK